MSSPVIVPATPVSVIPAPPVVPPPKVDKLTQIIDPIDRPVTPEELREANEILALGTDRGMWKGKRDVDTVEGVRKLRRDILEGRFRATKQRKKELGLASDVRVSTPPTGIKIKTKYTKEQFEKYLETARRLDEQKKKRLAEAIDDVMKDTK